MTTALDFRSTNALWASVLVETLRRGGVHQAVISPGSRSIPLTIALTRREGMTCYPVLDERSAAFFALGLAKARSEPVVVVCTSGTAAANLFPAVIEAHESGVPLIVITADRPPELRACASGQTIDQQKLYGNYAGFYHEFSVPALELGRLRYLRQTVAHALTAAAGSQPGPVHLNAPFRDPLPPSPDGGEAEKFGASIDWERFFRRVAAPSPTVVMTRSPALAPDVHGVIVAGPSQAPNPDEYAASVGELAARLGWPVLADGLSPLRNFAAAVPHLVTSYDTILRNPTVAERLAPDVVLCLEGWPTSKVLRGWIETTDPEIWLCTPRRDNRDALHGRTQQLELPVGVLATTVPAATAPSGYEQMWARYERLTRTAIDDQLRGTTDLFEPKAAWLLAQHLPEQTPLFIANSMPIRDVEYVWPAGNRAIRPLCNRGANGIDGTLSSALGVAEASGRPTLLLTGDLALLHDTNGFLLRSRFRGSLTIVLINNRGGGIFEHLPVAQFDPPFEEYFATPQDVDFSKLCSTYGVNHQVVQSWDQFSALVSSAPAQGIRVLELRTDRKRDAARRKQWFADLAAALG